MVRIDVPAPGAGIVLGLKLAVAPAGAPVADRLMALLNPPMSTVNTSAVEYWPCPTLTALGACSAKVGPVDNCVPTSVTCWLTLFVGHAAADQLFPCAS